MSQWAWVNQVVQLQLHRGERIKHFLLRVVIIFIFAITLDCYTDKESNRLKHVGVLGSEQLLCRIPAWKRVQRNY